MQNDNIFHIFAASTKFRTLLIAGALGAAGLTVPATAVAADLWSIYTLARDNDADFQAQRFAYQAEQQVLPQARAAFRPSVTANAGGARGSEELKTDIQFANEGRASFYSENASIIVSQSLYNRQNRLGVDQATQEVEAASLALLGAEQELLLRVARRYFLVLAARDNVGLARSNKTAIARQLELADERLEVGLGTRTDLFDAQARFQIAEAEEIVAQNLLDDTRRALVEITAEIPSELAALSVDAPLLAPDPDDVQHWVDRAMRANVPLSLQRLNVQIAQMEVSRQRSARGPVVALNLEYRYNNTDGSIGGPGAQRDATDFGVQVAVPLFRGGLISASTQQALYRYDEALQVLEGRERAALRGIHATFSNVTSTIRLVKALQQAVAAGESALQAKQEGFAAGLNTNLDVLDAQRDLFQDKRDHLRARYDYILNLLNLEQVAGSLSEASLRQINTWLD
jgi:outer membrane protein